MATTQHNAAPSAASRPEQKVQWTELFFDLIWVFAVTELTATLATAGDPLDVLRTLVVLAPLWWGWVGTTLLANAAGGVIDQARWRMVLFGIAGCGLFMAIAIPNAYGESGPDLGMMFAAGYTVIRLTLWLAMRRQRAAAGWPWPAVNPFSVAAFLGGPLVIIGAFLDGVPRLAVWGAAAVIQLISPRLLRSRMQHSRFEPAHLPERFGLFIILALGETVVAVGGQVTKNPEPLTLAVLALAFLIIVLLWWTYFHFGAPAVRHSLEATASQTQIVQDVFSYGHFIFVTGIILTAVGLKKMLAHPLDVPHSLPELMFAPGVALFLLGFCYTRWRMFGAATIQRFTAALLCAGLAVAAGYLPILVTGGLIAVVLLALNLYEAWIVGTGRPLRLLRLPTPKEGLHG